MSRRSDGVSGAPLEISKSKLPHRSEIGVALLQQAPQGRRHQKQAGRTGMLDCGNQIPRLIRRRMHDHRAAAEQRGHRECAAAAEIKRCRRHEPLPPVQAEADPVRQEPPEKMLMRNQRAFRPPGSARRQRQQQRRVAAGRKAAHRLQLLDFCEPLVADDFRGDIRRQRIVVLAQHEIGAEMPGNALLFDRGPPAVHRQDDEPGARKTVENAQMQAGIAQSNADDRMRRQGFCRKVCRDLEHALQQRTVVERRSAFDDGLAIRDVARVAGQRIGEVQHSKTPFDHENARQRDCRAIGWAISCPAKREGRSLRPRYHDPVGPC